MDTLVASMSRLLWVVLLWTLGCTYFSKLGFSSFEDTCSRMEVLDHTVTLFLVFWDTPILFSIVAAPIDLPTNSVGGSFRFTSSPAFIICRLSDDGHSKWYELGPYCNFDLHFSNNQWCWASFSVLVGHLDVFFREMSIDLFLQQKAAAKVMFSLLPLTETLQFSLRVTTGPSFFSFFLPAPGRQASILSSDSSLQALKFSLNYWSLTLNIVFKEARGSSYPKQR